MKFTVVGSVNVDLVLKLDNPPNPGETVSANQLQYFQGGKGANCAKSLASFVNGDVDLVGCVGNDSNGEKAIEDLKRRKVKTDNVKVIDNESTGLATIVIDKNGENQIIVYKGANAHVKPIKNMQTDFVILQNEIPLETTFQVLKTASATTVFNPSPLPKVPISEWPQVNILVVNEHEASQLAQVPVEKCELAFDKLLSVAELVIITLGKHGVLFKQQGQELEKVKSFKVNEVVDTTGAGDAFLAAFVSTYEQDMPLKERIEFAAKAGALAVTKEGASPDITRRDVLEM